MYQTVKNGDQGRKTSEQKKRAEWLMTQSGLGDWKDLCGLDQVAKIQTFLEPHYQIKIFSKDAFNDLIYKGMFIYCILRENIFLILNFIRP